VRIRWFDDISLKDRPSVGGKGGSLGELQRAGSRVPPGFVVTTSAFDACIDALERAMPLRAVIEHLDVADLNALEACSAELRARVEAAPLPQDLLAEIGAAYARLCADVADVAVAIRSSATTEDAADASFAGLQDTYLWVKGVEETKRMVRRCWASLYSAPSLSYRRSRGYPEAGVAMAVVVQRMVDARAAGVMFTRSPTSGDRSVITIEGAWGLGSAVVGGEVTPDQWVLGKITGEISVRKLSAKALQHVPLATGGVEAQPVPVELREQACLTDAQLQALREVGRRIERHYGCAQDIEWAFDRNDDQLYLLQSRPETVWSARESRPVAAAVANPLEHVMSIFGGRQ
jgi:pyruvate,water dikinase